MRMEMDSNEFEAGNNRVDFNRVEGRLVLSTNSAWRPMEIRDASRGVQEAVSAVRTGEESALVILLRQFKQFRHSVD